MVMCWILPGALICPGSWDPAVGPNFVRRGHRAPCHLTPWESPLYQAASPTQAQLWWAASGFPGSSWTAWRRTAWNSLAPTVGPLQWPYMIFPQWKTHSGPEVHGLYCFSSMTTNCVVTESLYKFHSCLSPYGFCCFGVQNSTMWNSTRQKWFLRRNMLDRKRKA